jgi:acetyl-CoA carboxylase biotin carboxylase subunit
MQKVFTKFADEAVCMGPAPSNLSYLKKYRILLLLKLQTDAIHQGYGFLSENSKFSKSVRTRNQIYWCLSND